MSQHFLRPDQLVQEVGVERGSQVIDIGCGAGHLVAAIAQATAPEGRVFALDLDGEALSRARTHAAHYRLNHIEYIQADVVQDELSELAADQFDYVFVKNVFHVLSEVDQKQLLKRITNWLHPEGKFCLIDWHDRNSLLGPPRSERLSDRKARELAEATGMKFLEEVESGVYHYGLIFQF